MQVLQTAEFCDWYDECSLRERAQMDARVARIEEHGHLGVWKHLGSGLAELRWKAGRRIYFATVGDYVILLI